MTGPCSGRGSRTPRPAAGAPGRLSLLVITLVLASGAAAAQPAEPDSFPGMALQARVEAYLEGEQDRLARLPDHAGLVFPVEQPQLLEALMQVRFYRDGEGFVLGSDTLPEPHGGGVLSLLLDGWRPEGRAAGLEDRFYFIPNSSALELRELYRGYKRQLFLPVPGRAAGEVAGRLPEAPQLPRMRFHFWSRREPVEADAYSFLGTMIDHEADPAAAWTNQLDQPLSLDTLLRNVRDYYLTAPYTERELEDHSNLHLVGLLLARDQTPERLEAIKRRFLAIELARVEFGSEWSEILGHYVESLGLLVASRGVHWQPGEKRQVREWLAALERDRFLELDGLELQPLCHLLRGLRLVEQNRARLE